MKIGFGVDLGGTTVKIASFHESGTMIDKWEIPTVKENSGKQILPDIASALLSYVAEKQIPKENVLGVGMGVPGSVLVDGTVNKCDNLGWGVCNPEQALGSLTGFRVVAQNDANIAALGEYAKGSGAKYKNILMVTLGTGVGGGIVLNGKALCGAHGAAGEIGHMVLHPEETETCGCGKKGCVEQYCSATGIVRMTKKYLSQTHVPSVLRDTENLTCKDVFDAAQAEDGAAKAVLEQIYDDMAVFIANICNVLNPEAVVIGGGVSKAGQPLLDGIQKHFGKYVYHAALPVEFSLASLGNDAGVYGAFQLIKE